MKGELINSEILSTNRGLNNNSVESDFINISYITSSRECELIESLSKLDKGGDFDNINFSEKILDKFFNSFEGSETLFLKNKYLYLLTEGAINYLEAYESMQDGDNKKLREFEIHFLSGIFEYYHKNYKSIDIVSIGSASFVKETKAMHNCKAHIKRFFPIDVSPILLQLGVLNFKKTYNKEDIHLNPILGDLWDISDMIDEKPLETNKLPFLQNAKNNLTIFTFLGSTFGNYHEFSILTKIIRLMKVNDVLIMGFDTFKGSSMVDAKKELEIKYSTIDNVRFLLEPLYHIPKYKGFVEKPQKYVKIKDSTISEYSATNDYNLLTSINDSICLAPFLVVPDDNGKVKKITLAQTTKYKYETFETWIENNFKEKLELIKNTNLSKENMPDDKILGNAVVSLKKLSNF